MIRTPNKFYYSFLFYFSNKRGYRLILQQGVYYPPLDKLRLDCISFYTPCLTTVKVITFFIFAPCAGYATTGTVLDQQARHPEHLPSFA